jgi:epoxyqueuosine reductase
MSGAAHSIQQTVQSAAQALGFHLAGITRVPEPDSSEDFSELAHFSDWVAAGRAGSMDYLRRTDEAGKYLRSSVRIPFPWARSVVVCAVSYNNAQPYSVHPSAENTGWIARYAWSGHAAAEAKPQSGTDANPPAALQPTDYHSVIRTRLENLAENLQATLGPFTARCFVDTGPLVERIYAKHAGLGWQGKNTCLIHPQLGSWFFLGVIITSLDLPAAAQPTPLPDRCGSCTRCIDACPTQCLEPYSMDASRCIAYLTIENRGEIAADLQAALGRNVFGCDICQEVCPWNRRAPVTDWPELSARPELVNPALDWLESLGEEDYRRLFRASPVARTKQAGLQRNVAIALRNQREGTGTASAPEDHPVPA